MTALMNIARVMCGLHIGAMKSSPCHTLPIDAEDLIHIIRSLALHGSAPFAKVHANFVGGRSGLSERLAIALADLEDLGFLERIPEGPIAEVVLKLTDKGRRGYPG